MASSGKEKFDKYFKNKTVEVTIKAKPGEQIRIYDAKGSVIHQLRAGDPITVPAADTYQARYYIEFIKNSKKTAGFVSETNVSKPISGKTGGATELLGIQASTLITRGQKAQYDYMGKKVSGYRFDNPRALADSVLSAFKTNRAVNRDDSGIIAAFEAYFKQTDPSTIVWNSEIAPHEINELGKYLGELLLGYMALKSKRIQTPLSGQPKEFFVPDDPSFKGVDTFMVTSAGTFPISNKFGVGAKASFFGNILPQSLDMYNTLPRGTLRDLATTAKSINIGSNDLLKNKGAKEIVYEYGVRHILGLKEKDVPKSYDVYNDIRSANGDMKKLNQHSRNVVGAIQAQNPEKNILNALPKSVTAYFTRTIADQLNSDAASIDKMLELVAGKGFYQANLDINAWRAGKIQYRITPSGQAAIKVIGSKSAIDNIEASQGLVNYEVKPL
jgi:hypothetical protein